MWRSAAMIVAIGTAVSLLAFKIARNEDDARVRGTLELRTEWRARDIEHKIMLAAEDVGAIAAYFTAASDLDLTRFHAFAHLLHGPSNAISALIWAPRVKGPQRDRFTAEARRLGLPDFDITERAPDGTFRSAAQREEYLPTLVEEDYDGAPPPFGFDIMSLPERWSAAERARDEGRPIATPPLDVYSTTGARLGFFVFWPAYTISSVPTTRDARRSAFRGVALGRFHFDRLLPALVADTPRIVESIDILVDRGPDGDTPYHAAHFDPSSGTFTVGPVSDSAVGEGVLLTSAFEVMGRHWTIRSLFSPAAVAELRSSAPWLWLLFGLVLTGAVCGVVQREHARRLRIEAVVKDRTADLSAANRSLAAEVDERSRSQERLRRSERELRQWADAFENAAIGIAIADPETDAFKTCNPAFAAMHGMNAEAARGMHIADAFSPEDRGRLPSLLATADRAGRANFETQVVRVDGSTFPALMVIATVRNADGKPLYRIVTTLDITERKKTEQALQQAQKMEAIGNLTGGLAHDFNNLLGVIIGNLDMVRPRVTADAETNELVDECVGAAWSGADLTRRLLAFSRRQPLEPERIDVNELVAGMVKLLRRLLGEDIEISLDLGGDLWPVVADPAQLEASIANLATNARDAMPKGGRLVIATANRHLDADYAASHAEVISGDYAAIEVSDTGSGISPESLGRIFEPFFTTKELGKGTGLGLSMVFGFVKQSGGHVAVYSEPGFGTTFRLYLPRTLESAVEAEDTAAQTAPSAAGETVLVVEDNPALQRVVVRQLKSLGYRAIVADNAMDALALLAAEKVHLLLTDVVMPGPLDGFGLARQVAAGWPHIKIIVSSGFAEKLTDQLSSLPRSGRMLSKPYSKEQLARLLREVLDVA